MNPDVFLELSKILIVTAGITGLVKLFKQPAIVGYIISGVAAGPFVLNIINSTPTLNTFSQIGIALLLFFVGLKLNPKAIKEVGKISLITGIGQIFFTSAAGFLILKVLGFSDVVSFYFSISLAFSSTIIIMKLLSDKKDLETLYGRISTGFLIVQDFFAITILLFISTLNEGVNPYLVAVETLFKGLGGVLILIFLSAYMLPKVMDKVAESQEYLLLFSITWCFAVASAFHYINLSIEAGALLAGISLSISNYNIEISSKMKPLRDFFLVLFFIMLGSQMVFSNIVQNIETIIILSIFVLVGNPIIVMILMGLSGYTKRNSFMAGLTVAQISEFSFIVITMAVMAGHIPNSILSIVTTVGIITFVGSTYMITYSDKVYSKISVYLSVFERSGEKVDEHKHHDALDHDIILFGYDRIGYDILHSLEKIKSKFLVVDYDPEVISKLSKQGYDCRYGDANDMDLLNKLNFSEARMIISTIPDIETNLLLINQIREVNQDAIISVVAHRIENALELYREGATYVILPHFLGGKHFSTMIEKHELDSEKFLEEKVSHLEHLKYRKEEGHEHPTHEED